MTSKLSVQIPMEARIEHNATGKMFTGHAILQVYHNRYCSGAATVLVTVPDLQNATLVFEEALMYDSYLEAFEYDPDTFPFCGFNLSLTRQQHKELSQAALQKLNRLKAK